MRSAQTQPGKGHVAPRDPSPVLWGWGLLSPPGPLPLAVPNPALPGLGKASPAQPASTSGQDRAALSEQGLQSPTTRSGNTSS